MRVWCHRRTTGQQLIASQRAESSQQSPGRGILLPHQQRTSPAFLTKPLLACSSLSLASSAELTDLTAAQQAQGLPRDLWGHVGHGQDLPWHTMAKQG